MAPTRRALRILDLGCSGGHLAAELRKHGHTVIGVDVEETDGVRDRVDEFVLARSRARSRRRGARPFDVVLAADVLEHVRTPERLLADARRVLAPERRRRRVRAELRPLVPRDCASRRARSPTNGGASSMQVTCGSSRVARSRNWCEAATSTSSAGELSACRSRYSAGAVAVSRIVRVGSSGRLTARQPQFGRRSSAINFFSSFDRGSSDDATPLQARRIRVVASE